MTINYKSGMLNDLPCDYADVTPLCKTSTTTWSKNTKRVQPNFTSCPIGWYNYNGHCYFIGNFTMTQYAAKAYCNIQGAFLAKITSQVEFDSVVSIILLKNSTVWVNIKISI